MPEFGRSEAVVLKLVEPLLDLGYELYVDNYYTSYPLAVELRGGTTVCGTLRVYRKHFPKEVVKAKLRRGEVAKKKRGRIGRISVMYLYCHPANPALWFL